MYYYINATHIHALGFPSEESPNTPIEIWRMVVGNTHQEVTFVVRTVTLDVERQELLV